MACVHMTPDLIIAASCESLGANCVIWATNWPEGSVSAIMRQGGWEAIKQHDTLKQGKGHRRDAASERIGFCIGAQMVLSSVAQARSVLLPT